MKPERIVISGGGTGGHIFPALAIADAFRRLAPGCQILFIGAEGRMEMEKVPAAGYPIEPIRIEGLNRRNPLQNFVVAAKLLKALRDCQRILRTFRAQLVVGTGGFVSGPALWAAAGMGLPVVIQEQNSVPGLTNKILGRKARLVCTAYPGLEKYFPRSRVVLTGNPVREQIENLHPSRTEACQRLGLDPAEPVVLVYGGSQGALGLNRFVEEHASELNKGKIQVLWQTGAHFLKRAEELVQSQSLTRIHPVGFIEEMHQAYAAADLVVSRAGAMTISELALCAKAAILVPLPTAAHNHQYLNARTLQDTSAAICIPEKELKDRLMPTLQDLIRDERSRLQLSEKIRGFARPHAAEAIVHAILNVV
ncbi:MAG: undecaprenyldiphospho-muramoylpentapeptide beta-N-acetylglucosaminyltransferase [Flavobacteriales bacterium]|nr:undecaprenyldiphospho-muramoylpentapeptide beta-N-acetylglucosaminyltransferase [Flavobacteriales bacterium]MDW8432316.1 undecaprenyldiphospho-muramoylpentapeptide beta-N-acetylglucosaminyltransferase [Flavobacteriales bacterium]